MKNLHGKGKGRVHPSPSTTTPFGSLHKEALLVLKVLPATIFALCSALLPEEKEVLAYLIARSSKNEEKSKFKPSHVHRPAFDCCCFECYTSYWIRWDSSPNRELIHQVIEAFEEHLAGREGQKGKGSNKGKSKKSYCKEKNTLSGELQDEGKREKESGELQDEGKRDEGGELGDDGKREKWGVEIPEEGKREKDEEVPGKECRVVGVDFPSKGLVRKVVPDLLGFLASRLWTVWGPVE
ncbi:hypothetical protein AMTRI_Chr06g194150 [Amborella trichopoda]